MKRWLKFIAGLLLIPGIILGCKLAGHWRPVQQIQEVAGEKDIYVNALFYTDSPVSYEARESLREKRAFEKKQSDK